MKYFQQLDKTDCGAACISMIASYFGKRISLAEVRSYAGTDISGTNINGLLIAARKYGLKGIPVKGSSESISPNLATPFVVHLHIQREEQSWIDHYAVVRKISNKKIELWDPDPLYKKQRLAYADFFKY